jgi:hypothetical protein
VNERLERRKAFRARRKAFLFARQKGVCCLQRAAKCLATGGAMQMSDPKRGDYATFEHLVPRSHLKGCSHVDVTVLLACSRCNAKKGAQRADSSLIEWSRKLWAELSREINAEQVEATTINAPQLGLCGRAA